MSYFVHAFQKKFLATKATQEAREGTVALQNGILATAGIPVWEMKNKQMGMGPGVVGIFDYNTNLSLDAASMDGRKFYIAASSLITKDKIGKFHGGYQIENKSKFINPRYINKAWKVQANDPVSPKKSVGAKYDENGELQICSKDFYCGETYYLRVDVKGTPAMRFARHNLYRTLQADGGCCTEGTVAKVNASVIYKQWAIALNDDPMMQDFVRAFIATESDTYAYNEADAELVGATKLFDELEDTDDCYIVILGAYEDTSFGNCSFQPTDYYGVEPIRIYASEVDLNGDPCLFDGLCVDDICLGIQANGLGEQKLRDILLHEKYLQNHVATDPRIREITMGDDILNSVDRFGKYDSVFLLHSVPRKSNADSLLDNDQYLLEIIMNHKEDNDGITLLEEMLTPVMAKYTDCDMVDNGDDTYSFYDASAVNAACDYEFPGTGTAQYSVTFSGDSHVTALPSDFTAEEGYELTAEDLEGAEFAEGYEQDTISASVGDVITADTVIEITSRAVQTEQFTISYAAGDANVLTVPESKTVASGYQIVATDLEGATFATGYELDAVTGASVGDTVTANVTITFTSKQSA